MVVNQKNFPNLFVLCAFCKFPPQKNQRRLPNLFLSSEERNQCRLPTLRIAVSPTPHSIRPSSPTLHSIRPSSPTPHSSRLSSLIPHFCCLFIFSDFTIQWCIQRHRSRVHGVNSRYQVLSSKSNPYATEYEVVKKVFGAQTHGKAAILGGGVKVKDIRDNNSRKNAELNARLLQSEAEKAALQKRVEDADIARGKEIDELKATNDKTVKEMEALKAMMFRLCQAGCINHKMLLQTYRREDQEIEQLATSGILLLVEDGDVYFAIVDKGIPVCFVFLRMSEMNSTR